MYKYPCKVIIQNIKKCNEFDDVRKNPFKAYI